MDDLLGILEELDSGGGGGDSGGSQSIPIGAQISPSPCQPSPVPSSCDSDSGIESTTSDSLVLFTSDSGIKCTTSDSVLFTVPADVQRVAAVEDLGGFGSEASYATIDFHALQLIHLEDVAVGEECEWNAMDMLCHKSGDASSNPQPRLEEEEEKNSDEVMESTSTCSTSTSELASNDISLARFPSVAKFQSYALKPPEEEEEKESEEKSVGRKRKRKKNDEFAILNILIKDRSDFHILLPSEKRRSFKASKQKMDATSYSYRDACTYLLSSS